LYMGSHLYKHIQNKRSMRTRTLLDGKDIRDLYIKDDSVLIQIKETCKNPMCKAALLEPKLKKALQVVKLIDETSELSTLPKCTFCGD
jgi:hypothetical protein